MDRGRPVLESLTEQSLDPDTFAGGAEASLVSSSSLR